MSTKPSKDLQRFDNPAPERDYEIVFECPEFTCLCPLTGQPDFAQIVIKYVPDQHCIETKSLKMYLWSFRDEGAFHEKVTNTICNDLVAAIGPRKLHISADFLIRGGIRTIVNVEHIKGESQDVALRDDVSTRKV